MEVVIGVAVFAGTVVAIIAGVVIHHTNKISKLKAAIWAKRVDLSRRLEILFTVQPCFKCYEYTMGLIEVSPNCRSIRYQCLHCKKKSQAPAGSPEAVGIAVLITDIHSLAGKYNKEMEAFGRKDRMEEGVAGVVFNAPVPPLPYEQTSRTPIPEAVRSEVWRRDKGCCVQCGTKQNLQFDHIIPVSQGGATTVANLQLLCQPCNGAKSNKI
ncbi:HNH endonuclease [Urbifossiella limnaea]|uniref:HNH endonuclease n=1 Tax=Urbifossiella limnaea TaxID=2528023 RepID=UPI0011A93179|nr:HNH endonuclease [Urbifossiella limnaea]